MALKLQLNLLIKFFLITLIPYCCSLEAIESEESFLQIPVVYKGRIRPLDAMARLWLEENYQRQSLKSDQLNDFHVINSSAISLLWKLQFSGYQNWIDAPLFRIHLASLKELLQLPLTSDLFSYRELSRAIYKDKKTHLLVKDKIETESALKTDKVLRDELMGLMQRLTQFTQLNGPFANDEKNYENLYQELAKSQDNPQVIAELLEQEMPLHQRLANAGTLFKILPAKNGDWYSMKALALKSYDRKTQTLKPVRNFTAYPDDQFEKIQSLYLKMISDYSERDDKNEFANLLLSNYETLIGKPHTKAWEKSLNYPSLKKLKIESLYYQLPLVEAAIACYGLALIFLMLGWNQKKRFFTHMGLFFTWIAFCLNTIILLMRCFVLDRPPVSNMFETVIYVPWVAVIISLFLFMKIKNSLIILGASLAALALLILLKITGLGGNLENVQAVLDSQFWLTIHVLMVVGSYGIFALAAILGHIYLFQYIIHEYETYHMLELGKATLQALYIGTALLIPGTLLGGVWAAQSWGRFWDWDPKESWAFISSCLYLIFIHAYRFKQIRYFGLAVGAILGFLAISFTWYGVNYILATGLHSYGFGAGGEIYYYLFILIEILFISCVGFFHFSRKKSKEIRKP